MCTQLLSLINNTPKPDVNIKIEFSTDDEKFQKGLDDNFGTFKKADDKDLEVSNKQRSWIDSGIAFLGDCRLCGTALEHQTRNLWMLYSYVVIFYY